MKFRELKPKKLLREKGDLSGFSPDQIGVEDLSCKGEAKAEVVEEKELKPEDVFGYGIDELREKMNESREMDDTRREVFLDILSAHENDIKEFSDKKPERMKEILEKMKDWNPEAMIKEKSRITEIPDPYFNRSLLGHQFLGSIAKFERKNPSEKMKKILDRIISKNGMATFLGMQQLNKLDLNDKEGLLINRIMDLEPEPLLAFGNEGWANFIVSRRRGDASLSQEKTDKQEQILLDEEKFNLIKENIQTINKKFRDGGIFIVDANWETALRAGEQGTAKKILADISKIQDVRKRYGMSSEAIRAKKIFDFIELPEEEKAKIFSLEIEEKMRSFKIKPKLFLEILTVSKIFENDNLRGGVLFKNEKQIKKVLSDFKIDEIEADDFRYNFVPHLRVCEKTKFLDKISPKNYFDEELTEQEKHFPKFLIERSSVHKDISSKFIENIRKTKGDYQARTFPPDLLKYMSSSVASSYLVFKDLDEKTLKKLENKSKESETIKKIYNKAHSNVLELDDVVLGRKTTKRIFKDGNFEYLLAAQKLNIPFDFYGILGKNLEEVKIKIDAMADELINGYEQNKDKYLPYIDSLLGYAVQKEEAVNETLDIKDLWDFKFSHTGELKLILEEVKNLKINFDEENQGQEDFGVSIKNIEKYLKSQNFSQAKEKISLIKEKNRNKALDLIEKIRDVSEILKRGDIPEKKDVDTLLSNRAILGHLGLGSSLGSVKQIYKKIIKEQAKEKISGTVGILQNPEEHFKAMDMSPSCMGVGGEFQNFALAITQGPILVLGVKNNFGKIIGRSILVPIKDGKGQWRFELKDSYGVGAEHIEDFAKKMEQELRNKRESYYEKTDDIITKEFIVDGKPPKSKRTSPAEELKFWREGEGVCVMEKA